jgi:hypothetical protein
MSTIFIWDFRTLGIVSDHNGRRWVYNLYVGTFPVRSIQAYEQKL